VQTAVNGGSELLIFVRGAAHSDDLAAVIEPDPPETHYRGALDIERVADLCAQGWTCARSERSWAFHGSPWAINFAVPGLLARGPTSGMLETPQLEGEIS
jgi:hypothetical protein